MKNTIITILTALSMFTSALAFTKEQAFAAMRKSIEADEFGFDVGLQSSIIVDVRTRHIKKMYTVPGEFPAKQNDQGNVFYYGYMDFKPGLLTSTKKAMAVFSPDGILVNWQILKQPGNLNSGWKNGLQSNAVRIRADRYRAKLNWDKKLEADRAWKEQLAEAKRIQAERIATAKRIEAHAKAQKEANKKDTAGLNTGNMPNLDQKKNTIPDPFVIDPKKKKDEPELKFV